MLGGRTQRAKIRAPRRVSHQILDLNYPDTTQPSQRSPDQDSFERSWADLAESFSHIHTRNASTLSYEELYRKAYEIVLRKRGDLLYDKCLEFEQDWLSNRTKADIFKYLAPELLSPISTASTVERRTAGERFLKILKQKWQDHDTCIGMLTDVTMYLVSVFELNI
jgi:cullin 3